LLLRLECLLREANRKQQEMRQQQQSLEEADQASTEKLDETKTFVPADSNSISASS